MGIAALAPIISAVGSLAGAFLSQPSAPSAPAPPEREPTVEPEGVLDQEAARRRARVRQQQAQERRVTKLEDDEGESKTVTKTLLGA